MSYRLKNLIWIVVIVVGFTLFTTLSGDSGVHMNFSDDAMELTAPEDFSITLEYNEMESLELVDLTDYGTVVNGGESRRYIWGTYQNEQWGQFHLYASKSVENALLFTMENGDRIACNFESEESTTALFDSMIELLAERKGSTAS